MRRDLSALVAHGVVGIALLSVCSGCGDDEETPSGPRSCDYGCSEGHPCRDGYCSDECSAILCRDTLGARADCVGGRYGSCEDVPCSRNVPCLDAAEICDVTAWSCFPESGECAEPEDCPYWGYPPGLVDRTCEGGTCGIGVKAIPALDLPGDISITVEKPDSAHIFPPESDVAFAWSGAATPVSALVLDGHPAEDDIGQHAIWGAVLRSSAKAVRWDEGSAILEGVWQQSSAEPPKGRLLFFVVLGLDNGGVSAQSGLLPFAVESGWLEEGDACDATQDVPSPCAHPTRLQTCVGGRCRAVCSSDSDCTTESAATACGRPIAETGYMRLCAFSE